MARFRAALASNTSLIARHVAGEEITDELELLTLRMLDYLPRASQLHLACLAAR